jgi:Cd(II)/Pb(II)-responsive transcriptional regulator
MKIGDLARAAQTQVETVRYYERAGLLPAAPRSDANYRLYGPAHVERLAFIRHCRALDMTLEEIRTLLRLKDDPQAGCGAVDQLLDEHLGHVAARIRGLKRLEKELKLLRGQCAGASDSAHCGILAGLTQTALQAPEQRSAAEHVGGAHGRHPSGAR